MRLFDSPTIDPAMAVNVNAAAHRAVAREAARQVQQCFAVFKFVKICGLFCRIFRLFCVPRSHLLTSTESLPVRCAQHHYHIYVRWPLPMRCTQHHHRLHVRKRVGYRSPEERSRTATHIGDRSQACCRRGAVWRWGVCRAGVAWWVFVRRGVVRPRDCYHP
jgi:hypothetical protein